MSIETHVHDDIAALPDIGPSTETQDFDAVVLALASHDLSDVRLTVSWLMLNGSKQSRDRLTDSLTLVIENMDIDILQYLLDQGIPFTLRQVEIAVRKESIPMLNMFLRHGWNINEPASWTRPPLLR